MSDQKISIDTRLAIQWRLLYDDAAVLHSDQTDFNNAPAIQLLEVLESQQSPKLLKSISSSFQTNSGQTDIARLETKLDLLLLLFTRNQYSEKLSNVPNFEVNLSADVITIKTAAIKSDNPVIDQLAVLDIFFNQNCSEAITFFGKVIASHDNNTVCIEFCDVGNITQSYLEKYIFRFHRNEIARIRHN